eukprot:6459578-Amphidinium_carterae.1
MALHHLGSSCQAAILQGKLSMELALNTASSNSHVAACGALAARHSVRTRVVSASLLGGPRLPIFSLAHSRHAVPLAFGACCAIRVQQHRRMQHAAPQELSAKRKGAVEQPASENFVEEIVVKDLDQQTHGGRVCTRFPPEPNGFLHIGHAKSICLNFGIASKFSGTCNLRFDDTNPASEKQEFIDSIQEDVRWLGFQWDGECRYASDYFQELFEWAVAFTERGWAYVDELSAETISELRGTLTTPGKDSPYRNRPIEESLELLRKMKSGELEPGAAVLRAKIDMQHRNVIMRDPIMYRIIKDVSHPRTGKAWCIYPSYDWAHGLSDALENVTHSVCTLEFSSHNELYDFFNMKVQSLGTLKCDVLPRQYEFARPRVPPLWFDHALRNPKSLRVTPRSKHKSSAEIGRNTSFL